MERIRKRIKKRIAINGKFRDWNKIYTNFATRLVGLFLLRVVNLVANVISWTNRW